MTLNEESKAKNPLSKEEKAAVVEFFSDPQTDSTSDYMFILVEITDPCLQCYRAISCLSLLKVLVYLMLLEVRKFL